MTVKFKGGNLRSSVRVYYFGDKNYHKIGG